MQASLSSLNQCINALRKKSQEREETSHSQDGWSQTCHTINDELGLNPQRNSRPTKEGHEQGGPLRRPSNEPDDRSQRLSPQNSQRDLDEETLVDTVARSQQEAECWERSENDAAKHHRKALDCMIQVAEEAVEHAKRNNLSRQEVIDTENELARAVQAKNSQYRIQKAGLNAEAHIASPTTRMVEPTFNRMMNEGDPQMDVEHETAHYHRQSIALTDSQGIPDHVDAPLKQYDGIARMIRAALAKGQHTDPDKSVLMWAGIKLDHPETYAGGSDLKEFKVFIAGILRWLKMKSLLGETCVEMQVDYLGTRLTGKAQEWFYRNVERFDRQVREWTLEMVAQGLQRRFLHTLTHHHTSNKFDMVSQGTRTIQEVLNDLKKYAAWMIHPPNIYTFCKWFVSALHDLLRNEVLKKGYNTEFSTIN